MDMKLIAYLTLVSFFVFNSSFADDTLIVIPNQNLLDETAHLRGLETSSSWSTVTLQIQSVSGELDKNYEIGSYVKFDKDIVFDLDDGADFLASAQALKQQVKALFEELQNSEQSKHSQIYSQKLKSIIETIDDLESKSPLKDITIEYLESLVDYYGTREKTGKHHFRSMEISEIKSILDIIDFNVMKELGKAYKPYFTKNNFEDYPLTKLITVMQAHSLATVYSTLVKEDSSSEICHENNMLDYCMILASKALSVELIHSPKTTEKNFYCELALMNDWLLMKPDAKPVTSFAEANNQYSSLRLKQSRNMPSYLQDLSSIAKECLNSYKGDVITTLVNNTAAYKFYQKGILAAKQDRAKKEAAQARLVRDARTQYPKAINDIVKDSAVDINQADVFYHQAVVNTETRLKGIDSYKGLSISELKKHLPSADVNNKINNNIKRISAVLALAALNQRDEVILLQKELDQAQASILSSIGKLTASYASSNDNLDNLNKSVIEMFDKLSLGQFSSNNKPVEQLAASKRFELLKTLDKNKLLSATGLTNEFKRLRAETESFSNRIGISVFEDEHINLLKVEKHKYKLTLQQIARKVRRKKLIQEGDLWVYSSSCNISYEYDFSSFDSLNIVNRSYGPTFNKFPFSYKGYATQKNGDSKLVELNGTIQFQTDTRGNGSLKLTQMRMNKKGLGKFKYKSMSVNYYKSTNSGTAFVNKRKQKKGNCQNETIELVRSNDLEILKYEGDTNVLAKR